MPEYNDKKDMNARQNELDEFWDISSLAIAPKKRYTAPTRTFDTSTAEIQVSDSTPQVKQENGERTQAVRNVRMSEMYADAAIPLRKAADPSYEQKNSAAEGGTGVQSAKEPVVYKPDHPLIEEVTLHPWKNQFPYYERFCHTAKELFGVKGERCESVSFFSYMPQYDQMNRSQLAWYLYLRELVYQGEYPRTDHSYIFLLIFEIINLPDQIPPARGLELLCGIWMNYREDYPLLDRYLGEWICDYCLLYRLPVPAAQLGGVMRKLTAECQLREFYVNHSCVGDIADTAIYLNCCSNYDYKKSRAYASSGEIAAAFDRHIPAALQCVLQSITHGDSLFSDMKMQTSTLTRDTFVGALCSYRIKYKIEVRYRSFSRSHELRFFITDVVKYAENKLRAVLGYKSRLSIYALPEPAKNILNEYFAKAFPKNSRGEGTATVRPDYEKLYDLPDTPMSSEQAARIEELSWDTTKRLVEAFEEEDLSAQAEDFASLPETSIEKPLAYDAPPAAPEEAEDQAETSSPFSAAMLPFLRSAYHKDVAMQRKYCREIGKMPEMLADEINEIAANTMGDILLEEGENGAFVVIEEYRDDIRIMLAIE
ncbi:MAG: TerB N-terminal domain-containing protein [Clostridia bacterium]|nr:TerB N-terminal domain-containing protein [Clostridia bacterium]